MYTRLRSRPPSPELKLRINENDVLEISFDHADQKLAVALAMANLGADDVAFFYGLFRAGRQARLPRQRSTRKTAISCCRYQRSGAPRPIGGDAGRPDGSGSRGDHDDGAAAEPRGDHPQQDAAERALNKLARTFATQLEALKRYRTGGTQKVTVEHVTVNAGGQAIVGNVAHGGRGEDEK